MDFSGHAGLDLSARLWRCHSHPEVATPVKFLNVADYRTMIFASIVPFA